MQVKYIVDPIEDSKELQKHLPPSQKKHLMSDLRVKTQNPDAGAHLRSPSSSWSHLHRRRQRIEDEGSRGLPEKKSPIGLDLEPEETTLSLES
ncbi:hypothetical protein E3N88_30714 [Mikania micrantha]|uniref:Uncharacterized protein n=1 Tax=Mikania micrantha TaxID=192012 RepID=A0A5N6MMM0_9ASTR|nr:hypothetical protein E3N88_30714 [Mikania micrantha]